jgi:cobalt-precorrin 5A hydrolase
MKTAAITLSSLGARLGRAIADGLPACDLYVHRSVTEAPGAERFDRVVTLTAEIFARYAGLVYIMPTGVVVRAIAGHLTHKMRDPAVVAVDVAGRWSVSLLSGHEGGANDLTMAVANVLDAEPVISTTTEAVKTVIAGVGCRRGTAPEAIIAAIRSAVQAAGRDVEDVRLIASADIKRDEPGLIAAADTLGIPLRFIDSRTIRGSTRQFSRSAFVQEKVNLPAVAEPAALLAGQRTELLLPKQKHPGVTVALATERCMWSE